MDRWDHILGAALATRNYYAAIECVASLASIDQERSVLLYDIVALSMKLNLAYDHAEATLRERPR